MREAAEKELKALGAPENLPGSMRRVDQFKELHYLAKLSNHDGKSAPSPAETQRPKGIWAFVYAWLFQHHQDLGLVIAFALFSSFVLFAGVAHSISIWSELLPISQGGWAELWFWLLSFGVFLPAIIVLAGRWVVKCGCNRAKHYGEQLGDIVKDLAAKAEPPPANPNPSP